MKKLNNHSFICVGNEEIRQVQYQGTMGPLEMSVHFKLYWIGWGKTGAETKYWEIKVISVALPKKVGEIIPRAAFQEKIELKT